MLCFASLPEDGRFCCNAQRLYDYKQCAEWVVGPMAGRRAKSYHRNMKDRFGLLYLRATNTVRGVLSGEGGTNLVEYGLLIALIALVAVASVILFGERVGEMWGSNADSVVNA